jgi:AcrR family transcriptional regulator
MTEHVKKAISQYERSCYYDNMKAENRTTSILDQALSLVRNMGFESVSIATLAKEVGMSKSGLFAHFNSKEKMHVMILDHAADKFSEDIFRASLNKKRGLPRLEAIISNWLKWYHSNGGGNCPFIAASIEYDSKPGVVKERIMHHTNNLIASISVSVQHCVEEGHFNKNLNVKKISFELYSLVMGHLIYLRTLEAKNADELFVQTFDELIERSRA